MVVIHPLMSDPVDARRSRSSVAIRIAYGAGVIELGLYIIWYFSRAILFLEGTGVVVAPMHEISTPYLPRVDYLNVAPGIKVATQDVLAIIKSPQLDQDIIILIVFWLSKARRKLICAFAILLSMPLRNQHKSAWPLPMKPIGGLMGAVQMGRV